MEHVGSSRRLTTFALLQLATSLSMNDEERPLPDEDKGEKEHLRQVRLQRWERDAAMEAEKADQAEIAALEAATRFAAIGAAMKAAKKEKKEAGAVKKAAQKGRRSSWP